MVHVHPAGNAVLDVENRQAVDKILVRTEAQALKIIAYLVKICEV